MKKAIGFVGTWTTFYLGDWCARLANRIKVAFLYNWYQVLMSWSFDIHDWAGLPDHAHNIVRSEDAKKWKVTCGVFLISQDNLLLIGHPTHIEGDDRWSIPKGMMDPGESFGATAVRELCEETGIKIDRRELRSLPPVEYKKGKKVLQPFYTVSEWNHDDFKPVCKSMVTGFKDFGPFPEIDEFRWVTYEEAEKRLHYTQAGLLPHIRYLLK